MRLDLGLCMSPDGNGGGQSSIDNTSGETSDRAVDVLQGNGFNPKLQGVPTLPTRYKKFHSGKVRETYEHPDNEDLLIMFATDRISTHDVIHIGTVPGKGAALTKMSNFWFKEFSNAAETRDIPNHIAVGEEFPDDFPLELRESAVIVKKVKPLPIEAIARGYLYGSVLGGYDSETGELDTGIFVGTGLQKCSKFEEPMFTPSTKSDEGDVNTDFETMVNTLAEWLCRNDFTDEDFKQYMAQKIAQKIKDYSLRMYNHANTLIEKKGLILGDTKFEFALDEHGNLIVIDEACTADSSRLWTAETVVPGEEPESNDKQATRDEVIKIWKKHPDLSGLVNGQKGFTKYPVQLSQTVLSTTSDRYENISDVFS